MTDARIASLQAMKAAGRRVVMVTAYDAVTARIVARAGADIALVGDSAANTLLGYSSTRQVTLDEMVILAAAVRRGIASAGDGAGPPPLVVGDMPYGSYETSDALAVASARRFADAGCDAVKLEGAGANVSRVEAIIAAQIPVMGHVGLLPQQADGSMRARGRTADEAFAIVEDARALERAGCFAIVFEAVPAAVTALVAPKLHVPVIGIGAGLHADGQVLVFHDLVGLTEGRTPRFVKRYADVLSAMITAVGSFAGEVRGGAYPGEQHEYGMDEAELNALRMRLTSFQ